MRVKRVVAAVILVVATAVGTPGAALAQPEPEPEQAPEVAPAAAVPAMPSSPPARQPRAPAFDLRRRIEQDIARTEGQKTVAYGGFGRAIAVAFASGVVAYGREGDEQIETVMNGTLIVAPLMLLSSYLLFGRHEKIGRLRLELDKASP